jgi:hypothetical protein
LATSFRKSSSSQLTSYRRLIPSCVRYIIRPTVS